HGARRRTEVHAQFARDDLGQRGFAEAGRPDKQHVVERLAPGSRGLDEDGQIGARLSLTDEFAEPLRTQRQLGAIVVAAFGSDEATRGGGHFDSSLSPSRISFATSRSSPASRVAAAI